MRSTQKTGRFPLPPSWTTAKLGGICETTSGGTPSRKQPKYFHGKIPWVKSGELRYNTILDTEEKITQEALDSASAKVFPKGTLLIALYGATIGKLAFLGIDAASNQAVCGILQNQAIDSRFLYNFLFHKRQSLVDSGIGGAQPNISQSILKSLVVPLPPLPEQHRIVEKIEALFSELDKGVEQLKTAAQQLKVYRQSVLKWAFEGKLTAEWRKSQISNPKSETARDLLSRIKQEREAQANATGKPRQSRGKPIAPLTEKELSELPTLPEGWAWVRLDLLTQLITKGESPKWQGYNYVEDGIPFVRSENVLWGMIEMDGTAKIPIRFHEQLKRSQLRSNDVLINLVGASIGRCGVFLGSNVGANINQAVGLIRCGDELLPKYLMYLIVSPLMQSHIHDEKVETARANLSLEDLRVFAIPFSDVEEQLRIIQEIESRLSVCDKLEETIAASLHQAEALRQSILKKAFEGKLVAQCPDDEPAAVLLERIKAEKQNHLSQARRAEMIIDRARKRKPRTPKE